MLHSALGKDEKGYLMDTCLTAQDRYKAYLDYFEIKYEKNWKERTMKVLLGTTNPSKVKRFSKMLENCDIEFITLKDLEIEDEPDETGKTP